MVDFTGGTWRSLIDGSEVSAIPDTAEDWERNNPFADWVGETGAWSVVPVEDGFGDNTDDYFGESCAKTDSDSGVESNIDLPESQVDRLPDLNDSVSFIVTVSSEMSFGAWGDTVWDARIVQPRLRTDTIELNGNEVDASQSVDLEIGKVVEAVLEVTGNSDNDTATFTAYNFDAESLTRGDEIASVSDSGDLTDLEDGGALSMSGGGDGDDRYVGPIAINPDW